MRSNPFIVKVRDSLRASWRPLVATDVLFKLLTFAVLTPILALCWQGALAYGGSGVLSDVDIAKFFAGPFGWCCGIMLGAIWLSIIAMEQASLLYILAAKSSGKAASATDAIRFSLANAPRVLNVSARLIGRTLLVVLPFLFVASIVYFTLLREYDINYYLKERPSEFTVAITIGGVLIAVLIGILLRFYSGWFLALPLVLFENVPACDALPLSRKLITGNRRRVLNWLVIWLAIVLFANILLSAIVSVFSWALIPNGVGSVALLATRVGMALILYAVSGIAINLFATIGFAGLLFRGYEKLAPASAVAIEQRVSNADIPQDSKLRLLTRWRAAAACTVMTLATALIGYWSLSSVQLVDSVQIMAHRGSSAAAPENTMAAFEQAIADDADWIEIDVQETADGEVVVVHDSDYMKLAGNPIKIWDATMDDLAGIDIGSWVAPKFSDQRTPTLAEVLRLCKDKVGVNIELKYYGHDEQLEQRVVDIVESEQMVDQIMVMSLKPEGIAKVKALRPGWRCGLLLSVYVGKLENLQADFLAVNANFATRNFVKRAHRLDKDVFVWTVNDAATMSQMLNRRVDGLLTDRPELAKQVLAERTQMSSAERLLAEIAVWFNQAPRIDDESI